MQAENGAASRRRPRQSRIAFPEARVAALTIFRMTLGSA
jgi:hypothetical protein